MKKTTGPSFIQRVMDLFRYEDDEPATNPTQSPIERNEHQSPDWHPGNHRSMREYNSADKSYESNIDRYKHPSDLHRSGW